MDGQAWEEAFLAYGLDAAVGRRYRGLTHNLNGVAQVFSMQTELLCTFFSRAEEIMRQLEQAPTLEESRELGRKLDELLHRRAALVVHLEKEVGIIQAIMRRTSSLMEGGAARPKNGCLLGSIIETELEFMNSDNFFKHRVRKEVRLEENIPSIGRCCREIHQIIGALLENGAQALAGRGDADSMPQPVMRIDCTVEGGEATVRVCDNGPGVAETDREGIFAPFYTTRPGHLGLGLYLARKMAERCRATLVCEPAREGSVFTLSIPVEEAEIG